MRAVFNSKLQKYNECHSNAILALSIFPAEKYSEHDKNLLMRYAFEMIKFAEYYLQISGADFELFNQEKPIKLEEINLEKRISF